MTYRLAISIELAQPLDFGATKAPLVLAKSMSLVGQLLPLDALGGNNEDTIKWVLDELERQINEAVEAIQVEVERQLTANLPEPEPQFGPAYPHAEEAT